MDTLKFSVHLVKYSVYLFLIQNFVFWCMVKMQYIHACIRKTWLRLPNTIMYPELKLTITNWTSSPRLLYKYLLSIKMCATKFTFKIIAYGYYFVNTLMGISKQKKKQTQNLINLSCVFFSVQLQFINNKRKEILIISC